jgi:type IV pilus assembly protein PilF
MQIPTTLTTLTTSTTPKMPTKPLMLASTFKSRMRMTSIFLATIFLSACVSQEVVVQKKIDQSAAIDVNQRKSQDYEYRLKIRTELAKNYLSERNYPAAIETIDEILKEKKEQPELLHFKAIALMGLQDPQTQATFQEALRLDPNNPHLMNNYAWALCKSNQPSLYAQGLVMLNKASELADAILYPKLLANQGICQFLSSKATGNSNQMNQAQEHLNASLKINPNYLPALLYKAQLLLYKGERARAEEIISNLSVNQINEPELLFLGYQVWSGLGNSISAKLWSDILVNQHPYSVEAKQYQRLLVK